ncbi:MAG: hypothetical protein NZL83_00065 [Candidatus Absconditabacterales bacterium]|nr:hypothetical protein [Candidatus Absconditabacterales bacterium]
MLDRLLPDICVGCKQQGSIICKQCTSNLLPHPEICLATKHESPYGKITRGARQDGRALAGCMICFRFDPLINTCIRALKYHHRRHLATFLSSKLSLLIQCNPLIEKDTTLLTRVPSHRWRRYITKGYNQSQLLANRTSINLSIPSVHLLSKNRHTLSQVGLNRKDRVTNLANAYTLTNQGKKTITDNKITTVIIIDDVVTTGTTLNECAKALTIHFPHLNVWGCCLARHG